MTPYSISLSLSAAEDIEQAFQYYNNQASGLGYAFIDIVDSFFQKISEVPFASAIRYDNVRVKPVTIFPFTIHYTTEDIKKQVLILRVFNTWQEHP
ncbi:MAG: hypothetical protein NTW29_18405 [Bacteroidetes bacterium]|nr:hypothetical protein [Bacteroidota bacterium]